MSYSSIENFLSDDQIIQIGELSATGKQIKEKLIENDDKQKFLAEFINPKTAVLYLDSKLNNYLNLLFLIKNKKNILIGGSPEYYSQYLKEIEKYEDLQFIGISTSGSTGNPKTVLHSTEKLIALNRKPLKNINFLSCVPGATIGGISSFLWSVYGQGNFYQPNSFSPELVVKWIEEFKVQILSCSPTFLRFFSNYLNINHELRFDSLKKILYGSEPMDQMSLNKISSQLNHVQFQQKYASTEFGFTPFKSKSRDSIDFITSSKQADIKIIDNKVYVKTPNSFINYLEPNLMSPKSIDGYFETNDLIKFSDDNSSFKILGRDSEWCIVSGKKIHLRTIEEFCLRKSDIIDCHATTQPNLFTGQILSLKALMAEESLIKYSTSELRSQIRKYFLNDPYFSNFVPQSIYIENNPNSWKLIKKTPIS